MNASISFTSQFILDKAHFNECFSESMPQERSLNVFFKSGVLMAFGLIILLFTPVNAYAGWFVVALGILEALSIHYKQPWWVLRQMLSKASGSEVTLTIDEKGVLSDSFYNKSRILWENMSSIQETSLGYILNFTVENKNNKGYLSKSYLSTDAQSYIKQKMNTLNVT
ncbi:YcxB family protein [Colwellia sp. MSW7]|jgi:hypothetical protein|uniref:YcxB family protein n=1 Tax=Colwellia maritima TaxID=2912588 RepID=A0ABS9WZV5_9GAMM|nr:YcxB family protein [Colwellia maritima]MCI2283558.1 YcxB family protein [Colwellia maritima]